MATKASLLLAIFIFTAIIEVNAKKQKRQIFREQVLPSRGGKIPEEAFRADRLALNRLNKEGITVPDGIVLEARNAHKHPGPSAPMPEVLKVYLTPEGRFVPPEGRYNYDHPKAVDTTYLAHRPIGSQTRDKFITGYNSVNKYERYPGHRQLGNPTSPRVYKPLLAPLIIPTREELLRKTYYPSWTPDYSWDLIYEPFDDYFINSIALFNSHQIITDYEGFLTDFHDRSIRHVPGSSRREGAVESTEDIWSDVKSPVGEKSFERETGASESSKYPGLTKIPVTGFTCGERRGLFADIETNCQVFHQCGASGKSSFLCAAGTIFNKDKKRCEWWDSVACKATAITNKYCNSC